MVGPSRLMEAVLCDGGCGANVGVEGNVGVWGLESDERGSEMSDEKRILEALERIADALEEIAAGGWYARTVSRKEKAPEPLPPFPLARIQERTTDVQIMVSERLETVYISDAVPMIETMVPGHWYSWPKDAVLKVPGFAPLDIAAELRKEAL